MINIVQARPIYTKKVIKVYDETIPVNNFLQSIYKKDTSDTLDVAIEIRRGTKNIAVEVQRGGGSNGNDFTKSSEKMYRPPMYSEELVANHMDSYNIPFGQGMITSGTMRRAINETSRELAILRDKISRAKELQCSEVIFDGTITTKWNDVIDFGRLAASKVDLGGAGGYWTDVTTDVEAQFVASATFIRNTGNSSATEFDAIMSNTQIIALKKTNFYKDDANRDTKAQLQDVKRAIGKAGGAAYHGTVYAGSYIFHLWTYEAVYNDADGVEQRFTPDNKTVILPASETGLILAHGGVPVISQGGMPVAKAGLYVIREAIDFKRVSHTWFVESAPLATCYTPDKVYTMQTIGAGGGQG